GSVCGAPRRSPTTSPRRPSWPSASGPTRAGEPMHALLLADGPFAEHERALLERIAAGLLGEGVRTTVALPRNAGASFSLVSDPIRHSNRGLIFTRRIGAQRVAARIAGSADPRGLVSVVHVLGGGAWAMGQELAEIFDAALALEIWRGGLIDRAT